MLWEIPPQPARPYASNVWLYHVTYCCWHLNRQQNTYSFLSQGTMGINNIYNFKERFTTKAQSGPTGQSVSILKFQGRHSENILDFFICNVLFKCVIDLWWFIMGELHTDYHTTMLVCYQPATHANYSFCKQPRLFRERCAIWQIIYYSHNPQHQNLLNCSCVNRVETFLIIYFSVAKMN